MKNTRILLLNLLIASLLLAACGGGVSTSTVAAPQPTKAAAPSATSEGNGPADLMLDPANGSGDKAQAVASYLYEGLMRIKDGAPVAALAESFTVSEDGLDYIFNLRPSVTFHDGSALNTDVVVANFNRWFDPSDANRGSGSFAAWAEKFGGFKGEVTADGKAKSIYDGIEKVNDLTVLVHLNTPDADFLTKLSDPAFSIVNPKAFNGGDGGTGAYKFASLSGSTATLEPFAGYWDATAIPTKSIEVPVK
jgi:peptide/nickel transport system substrate-binding protein